MAKNGIIEVQPLDVRGAKKADTEAQGVLVKAQVLKIKNQAGYDKAGVFLKEIKGRYKFWYDAQKTITDPLTQAKNAAMAFFKVPLSYFKLAEDTTKEIMLTFEQEQERIRKEEEEKLRKQAEAEEARKKKVLEARARKEEEKAEALRKKAAKANADEKARLKEEARKAEEKAEETREKKEEVYVPRQVVAPRVQKIDGINKKVNWFYRIVAVEKIPRKFMIPDEKKLGNFAVATKGTHQVAGVEFYSKESLSSTRS